MLMSTIGPLTYLNLPLTVLWCYEWCYVLWCYGPIGAPVLWCYGVIAGLGGGVCVMT